MNKQLYEVYHQVFPRIFFQAEFHLFLFNLLSIYYKRFIKPNLLIIIADS